MICRSHSQAVCYRIVRRLAGAEARHGRTTKGVNPVVTQGMKQDQEQTLSRASIFAVTVAAALIAPCLSANNVYSAARLVSQAEPIADQSVPKEAQSKPVPKTKEQSCWHPGLSRNIGIAELSCDFFNSEPRIPPQSTRPCSGNEDRRPSC
jgi:hypothetical protein